MGSSWTATRNQRRVENNDKIGNERELFYPPDEDIDPEAELISAASSGRLYSERELLDLGHMICCGLKITSSRYMLLARMASLG